MRWSVAVFITAIALQLGVGLAATATYTGAIDSGDPTTATRVFRDGVASTCTSPKAAFPGTFGAGLFRYDSYTFTNPEAATVCVTVTLSSANSFRLFTAAYLGVFDPTNLATNYLADAGSSVSSATYSFTLGAGQTAVIVVQEVTPGSAVPIAYTLTITTPAPAISALSPHRVPLTSTPQTITIRGSNFIDGATVTIGQRTYPATFVSSTELRVSVVPKDVFVYGWLVIPTATVRVTNPGGVTSNSLTLSLTL
jgi:hypothetical protein